MASFFPVLAKVKGQNEIVQVSESTFNPSIHFLLNVEEFHTEEHKQLVSKEIVYWSDISTKVQERLNQLYDVYFSFEEEEMLND